MKDEITNLISRANERKLKIILAFVKSLMKGETE